MAFKLVLREPTANDLADDLAWVVRQHGKIYAQEFGWNADFEVLVAGICADFTKNFRPEWER